MQRTIRDRIKLSGIGIHTGVWSEIILHPEPAGTGVRFLKDGTWIEARLENVVNTNHSTDLGKGGVIVKTVEHLLSVLHLLGIDNLTVEFLEGYEVPIMDGSGSVFYEALRDEVLELDVEKELFKLDRRVSVREQYGYIEALPSESLEVEYIGKFKNFLGKRHFKFSGNPEEVVYARTFCYYDEIPLIKAAGLGKGGSLDNTLVLLDRGVLNEGGMVYEDEPVRHKVLDLIGDLYLLGKPFVGRVISYRGGHSLNIKLLREIAKTQAVLT
jgi:UDP-3-O-[3-hydroxymyristoyl] N-acetylglucosamine deacetylase